MCAHRPRTAQRALCGHSRLRRARRHRRADRCAIGRAWRTRQGKRPAARLPDRACAPVRHWRRAQRHACILAHCHGSTRRAGGGTPEISRDALGRKRRARQPPSRAQRHGNAAVPPKASAPNCQIPRGLCHLCQSTCAHGRNALRDGQIRAGAAARQTSAADLKRPLPQGQCLRPFVRRARPAFGRDPLLLRQHGKRQHLSA